MLSELSLLIHLVLSFLLIAGVEGMVRMMTYILFDIVFQLYACHIVYSLLGQQGSNVG